MNGVVVSRSALQAEGLGFDPRQRLEPHKLNFLVYKLVSYKETFVSLPFFHSGQGHFKVKVIFEIFSTPDSITHLGLSEYFRMSKLDISKGG